jgi:hypothetical protein
VRSNFEDILAITDPSDPSLNGPQFFLGRPTEWIGIRRGRHGGWNSCPSRSSLSMAKRLGFRAAVWFQNLRLLFRCCSASLPSSRRSAGGQRPFKSTSRRLLNRLLPQVWRFRSNNRMNEFVYATGIGSGGISGFRLDELQYQ